MLSFKTFALACALAVSASCRLNQFSLLNARAHSLPRGDGRLAVAEGARLISEMATACSNETLPWAADVSVRGIAASYRVNRQLRVGLWPRGSLVRIESVPQNAADSFVFLISGGAAAPSATLLLDNGSRVVRSERTAPLLTKLIGAPFDPYELEALLRGCYPTDVGGIPTMYGTQRLLVPFGRNGRAYYKREAANDFWRLQTLFYSNTGLEPAWRMDLFGLQGRLPRAFAITGMAGSRVRIDIHLSNVIAASLPPAMFEPTIPSTSRTISLDEIDLGRLLAP